MKRVVITGACGHLGRMLFDELEQTEGYKVCGLDLGPSDHPDIHTADITEDGDWTECLNYADVVVHLAGNPDPTASWDSVISNNMDATLSLYHHTVAKGVKCFVYASSNWLHAGRRFGTERLTTTLAPHPVNAYGTSKLFGERTGAFFAARYGLSVICLRIGLVQWAHENKPGEHIAMGRWGQEMWLSDQDYLSGMRCAIEAEDITFEVLNLISDNPGMRWDIEPTKRLIGYRPIDGYRAKVSAMARLRAAAANTVIHRVPDMFKALFPKW